MLNALSKSDTNAMAPMTDEQLVAVEGGALTWLAVVGAAAYIGALKQSWEWGERLGDWLVENF